MKNFITLLIVGLSTSNLSFANDLQAKSEITETINRFMQKVDQKKFDEVEQSFTKDATSVSVFGGQPIETKTAKVIVDGWRQGLTPVKAVHHQVSNFLTQVEGKKARTAFYGMATWFRPENANPVTWFVGDYEAELIKVGKDWKISKLDYNNKFVNPPLTPSK